MKKIFLIIIAAVLGCVAMDAAQLTPAQTKAKKEIFTALKKYGTNITDDEEETISFKYDGTKFLVSIGSLNSQTLYLGIAAIFGLPNEYVSEIANIAAFNAAGGKPVCSAAFDGTLMFSCEMYAKDAKPFIAVIPEMLQALNSSIESFQEEYDKVSKTYTSEKANANSISGNASEFIYPKVKTANNDSRLYIKKVSFDSNYTILDMISYNGGQYQNCCINRNAYISVNGSKLKLIKAEGVSYYPSYTDYPGYDSGRDVSLSFRLYFPTLPKNTTSFDFSEGSVDGWHIEGIELKHGNTFAIYGDQIETVYHRWDCSSIEVQDEQTIITKTVTPKSEGTFMYSSQDEYIEDADTGRKYYLQNSSIGFEGSPIISHDTKTITFYEVYPALPSTVKRINISSGSQYYVKGLKIK